MQELTRYGARWRNLRAMLRSAGTPAPAPSDEPPLRAQPFSSDEMQLLGGRLARAHRLAATRGPDLLLARLRDNQRVLAGNCARLASAVRAQRRLTPAGEWLLDNAHLIEEQMRTARRHLPRDYSRELPRLANGASTGLPRVYDLALEAISHGDGRVDAESLHGFVAAYQAETALKLGELWAIPIMLRLALIENLRRVSASVAQHRVERDLADDWADRMIATAEADPKRLVLEIADMARSDPPQTSSFVAEIARRLQGQSSALAVPLNWIEQWLADDGHSIELMVQEENQRQAADQVSVSNSIGSLRFLSTMDWRDFVEAQSVVERTLEADPAGAYPRMDFATRDSYRHAVEALAKRSGRTEQEVAADALALANDAGAQPREVASHVGYYLVDAGRRALERRVGVRGVPRVRDARGRVPLALFLLPVAAIALALAAGLLQQPLRAPGAAWAVLAGLLALLAYSETAIALVNWLATRLARPRPLPRMDFAHGIEPASRTLVVVPTMLSSTASIAELVELLEVRFLANRDDHLHFALLTDHLDAANEEEPGDAVLLAFAQAAIEALNTKYPAPGVGTHFYLLHRPRRFNARQGCWMGHERKRGKLAALNALLRGRAGARDAFERIVGDVEALRDVEYVITLDSDTQLPRDSAREFVATLAHPLNRPQFDPRSGSVVRGYSILQPRVGASLAGGPRTRYAELYGSEPGIDPYTRAVSDVYQDLFDEGSFVGKGIYAVDAFERALAGRFPDNSILSHDLLEGCFARAGLVSDVQLYEDYPSSYALDVNRRHRWIRGDWQLLPWLLPLAPREDGRWSRNPLSALSRWKLFDNLRRSLVAPALVALLVLGWMWAVSPGAWTLWVLGALLLQPVLAAVFDLLSKPVEMPPGAHLAAWWDNARATAQRALLGIACLPFEAAFALDAIARTLWRLLASRRRLLEWQPSSEAQRSVGRSLGSVLRRMATAPVVAIAVAASLALLRPGALAAAAPVLLLWALAPWLMWRVSHDAPRQSAALDPAQARFLRRLARRTWLFFETWVDAENNHLPPDNVQHRPQTKVAHRTSPTNIGMSLLANLAAHDFGYLTTAGLLARTTATLDTLDRLPRHRGHFLNWYDTHELMPLLPEYVSTVDSGNLVGHLLTLRQGLLELAEPAGPDDRIARGLVDTLDVLLDTAGNAAGAQSRRLEVDIAALAAQPAPSWAAQGERLAAIRAQLPHVVVELAGASEETGDWLVALRRAIEAAQDECATFAHRDTPVAIEGPATLQAQVAALCARMDDFAQMDFRFLYDPARHLLAIGYHVADRRLDQGCYDLLASEARLASFVAIAQGQLPQETWFALSRLLNGSGGPPVLLSWSGSMFEYLMPQLVMPSYPGTLLDQTARAAVERQIAYGEGRGVAWGISESGYNTVDAQMNYQYRAFGVPSLGLQRGLAQELVVAPYASMLAVMVDPVAACANLERLFAEGAGGSFGLFEAIDHTPARLPPGESRAIVYSHMAHHQGMGLLALAYALLDQPMQRRFCADPALQATLLLLQERIPRTAAFHSHAAELPGADVVPDQVETRLRVFRDADAGLPAVQMLSNGRYHVMVSSAGGGYSRLRGMAITRWREDSTRDHWGAFCFLRDVASGDYWSTALQPTGLAVEGYEAIFSDAKAEFRGSRAGFDSHLEIAVSPEHDIELRRLRVTNRARTRRVLEITTYAEVVLAPAVADELHPAFSNLFVQTALVPEKQAIVCTRRARASDEAPLWMLHLVAVHDAEIEEISYETDRARFIGRGNTLASPAALTGTAKLSNSEGSVLDPIVAIRCRIVLAPEQVVTFDMVTGVSEDEAGCHGLIDKYRDRRLADRVFDLAWTHSQVVRRQLNASQADAQLYERLAGLVIYGHPAMRAERSLQLLNRRGQSGLWAHAISGDFPIVLLRIADVERIDLVRQLVQAHAYWRLKGLAVDLVIWNEDQAGYRQQLQDQIMGLIAAGLEANVVERPGGIFVRPAQQMSNEDRILLQVAARVIVSDSRGSLADQLNRRRPADPPLPRPVAPSLPDALAAPSQSARDAADVAALAPVALRFDNGLGGFTPDGREYVISTTTGARTPAPWSNVLANPDFGTVLSESALGYTWCRNAHEYRLTPWLDDPVIDQGGEAFYLRDEGSGRVWSPSALPCRGTGEYRTRHGFGYSVFEHVEDGIESRLTVFVALDAPVKFSVLELHNRTDRPRRLSTVGYVEWVLGDLRAKTQPHLVTELDPECGAVYARNAYNTEFEGRVGFFDVDSEIDARSVTCDRGEFIGRNGSLANPAAMGRVKLSGRVGAGFDACAAFGVTFDLAPGESREVTFRLGSGRDAADATRIARGLRGRETARQALATVQAFWRDTLGAVQVRTPEPAVDLLANGWLMYQTIACRFMARSGYYQSGGAYGFRDQLQDAMAMLHADPARVRAHLLLCAAHQFPEGDVQHWWHPPHDRGVRTRCSDDFLWLPLAASRYATITGDLAVFGERVHYIEGRALNFEEESYYDQPVRSGLGESLYQHCQRALERALGLLGERGLPLMASGDWNDGMNRVGIEGRGESVWLGFFLYEVLGQFSRLAAARDDWAFADRCLEAAERLRVNLEAHAWDGDWYRRAWFDNGAPLGSVLSDECRIDSISQSWAVLSGAADPARARQAMASLDRHLVRRDAGLVKLLDPPFDRTAQDPGYIRGYVPGVRENGGQYTHAAVWTTMAFARMGDPERAWELLRMVMPIAHGSTAAQVATYKVEPYVVAADVYAVEPHVGRGGWTWYTGSAGWMYRLIVESLLGIVRRGDTLSIAPCIPRDWPTYGIDYRFGSAVYRIEVTQSATIPERRIVVDGIAQDDDAIALVDDGGEHAVSIALPLPA